MKIWGWTITRAKSAAPVEMGTANRNSHGDPPGACGCRPGTPCLWHAFQHTRRAPYLDPDGRVSMTPRVRAENPDAGWIR